MIKPTIKKMCAHNQFRKICNQYKVRKISLFGSAVKGRFTQKSDVDFLVDFDSKTDLLDVISFQQDLEKYFGRKVDVVTPNSLSPYLKKNILKESVDL